MRKPTILLAALAVAIGLHATEIPYDYIFFDNSRMPDNYFYTQTVYTGPSWVENESHHLPVDTPCVSPGNSLRLRYVSAPGGNWQADVQYAPVRGNDFFRPADFLSFYILSSEGTNPEDLPQIALRRKDKSMTATVPAAQFMQPASDGWQHVRIPLSEFGIDRTDDKTVTDLAAVVFLPGTRSLRQHTTWIDDIELLPAENSSATLSAPEGLTAKAYERHIDLAWTPADRTGVKYYKIYRSLNGKDFEAIGISRPWMHRYTDFVGSPGVKATYRITACGYDDRAESGFSSTATATTYPMTDSQLLDMVQEACFRYYWDGAEPNSGLARENIPGRTDMIATGASGFGIMATIVGIERGFITREEGVGRFLRITEFLEKADKFHGAFPHFIDGITGHIETFFGPKDNGADLVETSFIFEGLLAARQYFNRDNDNERVIRERIDRLWKGVEWDWFRKTPDSPFLYWHWSPDQAWVINHKLIGWNETMITYLLAIMSPEHGVDPAMYYTGWASQSEEAQAYRQGWGVVSDGSMYTNGNTYFGIRLKVAVSNGGPLFFTHYSFLGLDPHGFTDRYTNYYENNRNIALINYRYCLENQGGYTGYGPDCWGLTASDHAWEYQAQEPVPYHDNGTIAPTGAIASFPYTPEESMAALKNYYRNYGSFLWGEYGFRDAFNLTQNWVSPLFMGLNQGPMVVMIENYRTGLVWRLFMSHPDVQRGLRALDAAR